MTLGGKSKIFSTFPRIDIRIVRLLCLTFVPIGSFLCLFWAYMTIFFTQKDWIGLTKTTRQPDR